MLKCWGNLLMSLISSRKLFQIADDLGTSPIPAGVFGTALLLKGITQSTVSNGVSNLKPGALKPTRLSCFTFGAANLLGSWMSVDGDPVNAAGFNFAWSSLYVIVNGKASVSAVFHGKISPLALSVFALGNASLYGVKFFWPGSLKQLKFD